MLNALIKKSTIAPQIRRYFLRCYIFMDIMKDRRIACRYLNNYRGQEYLCEIQDEEQCPCDSGLKFEECCKTKRTQQITIKQPINIFIQDEFKKTKEEQKECLYPDNSRCGKKIINAHAIQNSKILSLLANKDNCVYLIDHTKKFDIRQEKNGYPQAYGSFIKVVCSKATTQMCFCDYHDSEVFKPIENKSIPFDRNSKEMLFLYAYRAFIFEYAKNRIALEMEKRIFKENFPNFNISEWINGYRLLQTKSKDYEETKKEFDSRIISADYDNIYACIRVIPYKIGFAINAFFSPSFDLNGNLINNIDATGIMHGLGVTVFPEDTISYIILSCQKRDINIYSMLFRQINKASEKRIALYFNHLLPVYSENIVLSEALWNTFSDKERITIENNINSPPEKTFDKTIRFGKILRITLKKPSSPCGKTPNLFKRLK